MSNPKAPPWAGPGVFRTGAPVSPDRVMGPGSLAPVRDDDPPATAPRRGQRAPQKPQRDGKGGGR